MGKLVDLLTNPNSPLFDSDGNLKEQFRNPDAMKSFILQHQHEDPDWMNAPTAKKMATLQAVGVSTKTMELAAQRKAELDRQNAEQRIPGGGHPYQRIVGGAVKAIADPLISALKGPETAPVSGFHPEKIAELGSAALGAVTAPYNMARGAIGSAEEARAQAAGEPADVAASEGDVAEAATDVLALGAGAVGMGVKALRGRGAAQVAQTESGPIKLKGEEPTLMDTEGGQIEENVPPPPAKQEELNLSLQDEGIDPNDPKQVFDDTVEKKTGQAVPSEVTVGETPISTSELDDSGAAKADLATGAPIEAVHEGEHISADITGEAQPPEDNQKILDRIVKERPSANRAAYMSGEGVPGEEDVTPIEPEPPAPEPGRGQTTGERQFPSGPKEQAALGPDIEATGYQEPQPGVGIGQTTGERQFPGGPKEQAAIGEDVNAEPWITDRQAPGASGKMKGETPATAGLPSRTQPPADRSQSLARKITDRITRTYQALVAFKSPPHIVVSNQVRLLTYGIKKAVVGEGGEAADLFERMYTSAGRERTRDVVAALIEKYPDQIAKFMSGGIMRSGEGGVADVLGAPNFWAHSLAKKAMLVNRLKFNLQRAGMDLDAILAKPGGLQDIPKEILDDSFAFGNKYAMTYEPRANAQGLEGTLGSLLQGARKAGPVSRLGVLFPRFMANNIIAMSEDNPLLLGKIFSKNFVAEIGSANTSKAMAAVSGATGIAAMIAGYQLEAHNPKFATAQVPGTDTSVNLVHQIPGLGQWAAIGATAYRLTHAVPGHESEAYSKSANDLVQSLFGISGIGVTIIGDAIREGGTGGGMRRTAANAVSVVANPLQVINDTIGLFDKSLLIKRDTSGSMLGPTIAKIPYLNKTLPEQRSPERAGTIYNTPGYLAGVRTEQANTPAQNEIERLGIRHPKWYPVDDEAAFSAEKNLKYRTVTGDAFEKKANELIGSSDYKSAPDVIKREMLEKKVMSEAEAAGRQESGAEKEELYSPAKKARIQALK